jgi:hypothetical protein
MTVHDLIELLSRFSQDLPVTAVCDDDGQELPLRAAQPVTIEGGGAAPLYVAINVTL